MPLVVKPNPRRMRAFLNSPAERPGDLPRTGGFMGQVRWDRVLIAVIVVGAVAVAVVVLAGH